VYKRQARSGGSYVRVDLVSNVPVKAVMKFKDVSMKLTSVKALQIVAEDHEFVLRDIPIEKE
jgi:hypothetical protein